MSFTKKYVHKYIDWNRIDRRLKKYKSIGSHWSLDELQGCSEKPPFYCHYISWILSTWEDDQLIEFIDKLLYEASILQNWDDEKGFIKSSEYHIFYGLMWQMQVAVWLKNKQEISNLKWNKGGGPDLVFEYEGKEYNLECYIKNKSYSDELFVEEVLRLIDSRIKVKHQIFMKHTMKCPNKDDNYFDNIFKMIDEDFDPNSEKYFKKNPVIIYSSEDDNIVVYFDNGRNHIYDPSVLPPGGGQPESYINQMITESIKDKNDKNKLRHFRPNILAINFLLSSDLQMFTDFNIKIEDLDKISCNIDNIYIFKCGIDKIPKDIPLCLKGRSIF